MKIETKFFRRNLVLSILILLLGTFQTAFAQNRKISGSVVSATSEPVVGASVVASGTSIGTSTDADGNFSLTLPEKTTTIIVSCIGYSWLLVVV